MATSRRNQIHRGNSCFTSFCGKYFVIHSFIIYFSFGFLYIFFVELNSRTDVKTHRILSSLSFACIKQLIVLQHITFYCLIVSVCVWFFSVVVVIVVVVSFHSSVHVNLLIISKLNRIINSSLCEYIA